MEHANPILLGNNSPQKFITIGEVMLRLTPPNYEKIRMASSFSSAAAGSTAIDSSTASTRAKDSSFFMGFLLIFLRPSTAFGISTPCATCTDAR